MDYSDRIKRSMELLDALREGWEFDVDLRWLDMGDTSRCVLGQLYGNLWKSPSSCVEDEDYGFFLSGGFEYGEAYAELTEQWRDAINARLDTYKGLLAFS
jgi:hypothetical protein